MKRLSGISLHIDPKDQRKSISEAGLEPIFTYNQTDFVKQRVAVEVQFGKYSFVAHDLFVKHMSFFVGDVIDLGIEVLPMKALETQMSSGVPYYERPLQRHPPGAGHSSSPLGTDRGGTMTIAR
jgi:hypothetical protein